MPLFCPFCGNQTLGLVAHHPGVRVERPVRLGDDGTYRVGPITDVLLLAEEPEELRLECSECDYVATAPNNLVYED